MSDLIKREDAIDAIGADIDEIDALDPSAGIKKACIRRAIWKVMGVPSADRPQGWIPCSERLPKYYDEYLVTLESPQMLIIGIAEYEPDEMLVAGGKWYLDDYDRVHSDLQVIAWMPLPEPWKGADDETTND